MAALSDYLENALIDFLFKNNSGVFTTPGDSIYVALSTADPLDTAAGLAEPAGGSYARVQVTAANWTDNANGSAQNAGEILFPAATANWGTITHVAIMDALTVGNMLFHGALTASRTINDTDQFRFAAGSLVVTLA